MKQRYHTFRRENGIYYSFDTLTQKRSSLNTSEIEEANCDDLQEIEENW